MAIIPLGNALTHTFEVIAQYQKGQIKQIQTKRPWFDSQGGLVPQSIITIFGSSFSGKSWELEELKKDIMSVENNPDAKDYVWCSNSFEMTNMATTIRDLKTKLGISKKELLNNPFSPEQKAKVREYSIDKKDGRYFVNYVPVNAKGFLKETRTFLEAHRDKKAVFIDIDHLALVIAEAGNKKLAVDDVVEGINALKNEFHNFYCVFISQANREVLLRIKDKDNGARLRRSDLYGSDTIYHASDYVIGLQNAAKVGIEEYLKVFPEYYSHLAHRFTKADTKGKVSFHTRGCIFVEILKSRDEDGDDFIDLFTIEFGGFEKPKEREPKMEVPRFEDPTEVAPIDYNNLPDVFS